MCEFYSFVLAFYIYRFAMRRLRYAAFVQAHAGRALPLPPPVERVQSDHYSFEIPTTQ